MSDDGYNGLGRRSELLGRTKAFWRFLVERSTASILKSSGKSSWMTSDVGRDDGRMGIESPNPGPVLLKSRSPAGCCWGAIPIFCLLCCTTSPPPEVALTFLGTGREGNGPLVASPDLVSGSDSEALLEDGIQTTRFRTWSLSIWPCLFLRCLSQLAWTEKKKRRNRIE